jgi:hypothetical protein
VKVIDAIGPVGMAGHIRARDTFQWAVQTPRELAEESERQRNRARHGVSVTDAQLACHDCGSDLHQTGSYHCPIVSREDLEP